MEDHKDGCIIYTDPMKGCDCGTWEEYEKKQEEGAGKKQVGGSHYKDLPIQPIDYILANGIGYAEGNTIKYVSRWRKKGGLQDLEKAKHYLEMLIEHEKKETE